MKITINSNELKKTLAIVGKAAAKRSTLPALEGAAFKTVGNDSVTVSCYNLELGIITSVKAVVDEAGEVVINASLLNDIVKNLGEKEIQITSSNNIATIETDDSKYNICAMPYKDFPEMPEVNARNENNIVIAADVFKNMIAQTLYAISDSDTRPVLMGALFEIKNGKLRLVATDGFRLIYCTEDLEDANDKTASFIVPKKSLEEVSKLIGGEENVKLSFTRRHAKITFAEYTIIIRLIEGNYMNYEMVIPTEYNLEVVAKPKDIISACGRMGLLINDSLKTPIKCTFDSNGILFECESQIGSVTNSVSATVKNDVSDKMTIGFNNKYLTEAVKNIETDEIHMFIDTPTRPIILKIDTDDKYLALVLPVRLATK